MQFEQNSSEHGLARSFLNSGRTEAISWLGRHEQHIFRPILNFKHVSPYFQATSWQSWVNNPKGEEQTWLCISNLKVSWFSSWNRHSVSTSRCSWLSAPFRHWMSQGVVHVSVTRRCDPVMPQCTRSCMSIHSIRMCTLTKIYRPGALQQNAQLNYPIRL